MNMEFDLSRVRRELNGAASRFRKSIERLFQREPNPRHGMVSEVPGKLARIEITRFNGTPAEVIADESGHLVKFKTGRPATRAERRTIAKQIKKFIKQHRRKPARSMLDVKRAA